MSEMSRLNKLKRIRGFFWNFFISTIEFFYTYTFTYCSNTMQIYGRVITNAQKIQSFEFNQNLSGLIQIHLQVKCVVHTVNSPKNHRILEEFTTFLCEEFLEKIVKSQIQREWEIGWKCQNLICVHSIYLFYKNLTKRCLA